VVSNGRVLERPGDLAPVGTWRFATDPADQHLRHGRGRGVLRRGGGPLRAGRRVRDRPGLVVAPLLSPTTSMPGSCSRSPSRASRPSRTCSRCPTPSGTGTTSCSCLSSPRGRWRTRAASPSASPTSSGPRSPTRPGSDAPRRSSTRWPTCGSVTWSPCGGGTTCGSTSPSPPSWPCWSRPPRPAGTDAWVTFHDAEKSWARFQDQLPSTHPVADRMPDVESVHQNFDGITYAKGASVLRQLVAWVGQEAFLAGCREYFDRHAWGNTTLADFLAALERASGRELDTWRDAWLLTTGLNELGARGGARRGRHLPRGGAAAAFTRAVVDRAARSWPTPPRCCAPTGSRSGPTRRRGWAGPRPPHRA
jgi:hypothetical protein